MPMAGILIDTLVGAVGEIAGAGCGIPVGEITRTVGDGFAGWTDTVGAVDGDVTAGGGYIELPQS